jgi:hypothetical protein
VVFDGTVVSRVGTGDSVEFPCDPGLHTLWIKIDFKKSNLIDFTVHPGGRAQFECEPGGPFLMALVDLFRSGKYVKVHQLGNDEEDAS